MQIYLPIAETSVDMFSLLGLGCLAGFLSGLYGVGGGFIISPILIFFGIPPLIAVGTQANYLIAASVSGFFAYQRRQNVDIKMGFLLVCGGICGSILGVLILAILKQNQHTDLFILILYVLLLLTISFSTFYDVISSKKNTPKPTPPPWLNLLPVKIFFPHANLQLSIFIPISIGLIGGIFASLMGIGGGFLIVPAMIYLLKISPLLAIGTSLFQMIFTALITTILQAIINQTVDVVLAFFLLIGAVFMVQFGTRINNRLKNKQILRLFFALLTLSLAIVFLLDQILIHLI